MALKLNKSEVLFRQIYCQFTLNFIKEWLEYSQDYRLITDSPNECGLPNYPEFADHRHDQAIFNILCLKYNLPDPILFALFCFIDT